MNLNRASLFKNDVPTRVNKSVKVRLLSLAALVASALVVAAVGCTQKNTTQSDVRPAQVSPDQSHGNPALQFDYKKSVELLIAKNDPRTGDQWTARLVRDGKPSPVNENRWTIALGPDSTRYGDHQAYGYFILHLLDTVRTLRLKPVPLSGTPESFGLVPPFFMLKWKVADSDSGTPREFELSFGAPVKGADGKFKGLYASIGHRGTPEGDKIYVAQGATLEMLNMITSFETLRLRSLTTFSSDDIDQVDLDPKLGKRHFYAQRDGDTWTDAKHHPVKPDVDAFLAQVTHYRILKFIDDPAEQKKLQPLLSGHPTHTVVFKDRSGTAFVLQLTATDGKVYATLSTRRRKTPDGSKALAPFEVYPNLIRDVQALRR